MKPMNDQQTKDPQNEGSFDFMLEEEGLPGVFAVFSQDDGAGYFFIYKPNTREVLAQVQVYVCSNKLPIHESDISLMWSRDKKRCGVVVWGRMRAVIDIGSGKEVVARLEQQDSPAITDSAWLEGFENYLDQAQFIRARQRFWKEMAKRHNPNAQPKSDHEIPICTNFVIYERAPGDLIAVFEDDKRAGYLYLYDSKQHMIIEYLHVYDVSQKLEVGPQDVEVVWSKDGTKCGVIIWRKMRGIIDRRKALPGRVWIETRDTPGIVDEEWLKGFEYLRS
jgi:hypothetical protein